jgi:hypothetical protein
LIGSARQEVVVPGEGPLDHDTFLFLAAEAGLDTAGPHLDELFSYLQSARSGTRGLEEIETAGAEPDLAFNPSPGEN